MGCDIHSFIEVKKNGGKKWKIVGRNVTCGHYRLEENAIKWKYGSWWDSNMFLDGVDDDGQRIIEPIWLQSYGLFAILANVRNGGGVDIKPISRPRGIPKDASVFYKKAVELYGHDGHSHSWLKIGDIDEWLRNINNNYTHNSSKEVFREILAEISDELKELHSFDNVDDVRLVFFFDN